MQSELPFKIAFGIIFILAVSIAAGTARKAKVRHGGGMNQLAHEVEGLIAARAALGLIFYFALGMWLFAPARMRWAYLDKGVGSRWVAVALAIPTLIFFWQSFHSLGENYRGGVGLYDEHSLITRGPYRLVRHPIYLGFIVLMILVLFISENWILGISGLLLVTSIAAARVGIEERELRERFGSEWEAYARRTGAFFPRLTLHGS